MMSQQQDEVWSLPGSSAVKLLHSLSILLSGRKSHVWSVLKEWGVMPYILDRRVSTFIIQIFLYQRLVSSPPPIYSDFYLYQYGLMDIYFILQVVIQCYFILSLKLFILSHWELSQLAPMSLLCASKIRVLWCGFFFLYKYFMELQDASNSS